MDLLGHASFTYSSDPKVMLGILSKDFVKPRHINGNFDAKMIVGRELHTGLDVLFDTTTQYLPSRKQLGSLIGYWAGPVFDVCSDYVLANNWNQLFATELSAFAKLLSTRIVAYFHLLPDNAQSFIQKELTVNELMSRQDKEKLERTLMMFATRRHESNHKNPLSSKIPDVVALMPAIEDDLIPILPGLRDSSHDLIRAKGLPVDTDELQWRKEFWQTVGERSRLGLAERK